MNCLSQALIDAARNNHLSCVKYLIKHKVTLGPDPSDQLMIIAINGHYRVFKYLQDQLKINLADRLLHEIDLSDVALTTRKLSMLKYLLTKGCRFEEGDSRVLVDLVTDNQLRKIKFLVTQGHIPRFTDYNQNNLRPAFRMAFKRGYIQIVRFLYLQGGCDEGNDDDPPWVSVHNKNIMIKIIQYLIYQGVEPRSCRIDLDDIDDNKLTFFDNNNIMTRARITRRSRYLLAWGFFPEKNTTTG
jgi:hypothetical protein